VGSSSPTRLPKNVPGVIWRVLRCATDKSRPMLVHLVVTRQCNLDCGYCNEYDDHSAPVSIETLLRRVDKIADLGTVVLTLTGGEVLLHPELDRVVERAVSRGMVCTGITNGYPLTAHWIERLNCAGLTLLQISIDNLEPNEQSCKSLSKLKPKLQLLKTHAKFLINVNAVLGSCLPSETRKLAKEIRELGFYMTVNLRHDGNGQVIPSLVGNELASLFEEMRATCSKSLFHRFGEGWERRMIRDGVSPWRCRAGAKYFYVDEFGLVSYCSQRRGSPGTSLEEYGRAQMLREYDTIKECAPQCTILCVRRSSSLDEWQPQRTAEARAKLRLPVVVGRI